MRHEQPENRELESEILEKFATTFIPRFDMYPMQRRDGRYITYHKPLTYSLIESHIQGRVTLGAYALDQNNLARWVCFDADRDTSWLSLQAVGATLIDNSVPAYLEQSRRGGHLWLFLPITNEITGTHARRFGRRLLEAFGVERVEPFPKQDKLTTGPGSLVRLPLGRHRKDGRRYHFIFPDGTPLSPTIRGQLAILAEPKRIPEEFFLATLSEANLQRELKRQQPTHRGAGEILSERIKDRITVYEFIGQFIALDDQGTGYCPFHHDTKKSFGVNQKGNYWHCFAGCGGGSIIDFWMKWRELHGQSPDFSETLDDLREMLF